MKHSVAVALALVTLGFAAAHARGAALTGQPLEGWVEVVAYSGGADVRICPDTAILVAARNEPLPPADCSTGLPATGVQIDALPNQSSSPDEQWGYLDLTGTYDSGTFTVSNQSTTNAGGPAGPSLSTPPCPRPRHGWRLVLPTDAQWHAIERYQRHHRHDITSLEMFDGGSYIGAVATIASTHPRRARKVLLRAWPRQLCVVRSRYTMEAVRRTQRRMVKLLMADAGATYGWVTGAGGETATDSGQPATSLDVLIETPQLSAILAQQPQGLVALDATLHPVTTS